MKRSREEKWSAMCVEGGSEAEGALLYTDMMGKREQGAWTVVLTLQQLECSRQEMDKKTKWKHGRQVLCSKCDRRLPFHQAGNTKACTSAWQCTVVTCLEHSEPLLYVSVHFSSIPLT